MFYIYHIPNRKEWGCTNNLKRRLCQLKYKLEDVDRIITAGNINIANEIEKNMNIEYGYWWSDANSYKKVLSMHSTENRIKGGKIGGKIGGIKAGNIAKQTGQIYNLSKNNSIKIIATNLINNNKTEYNSIQEAARILNLSASKICAVCKGNRSKHMNYIFNYK
jgi:hypothetical protein